MPQDAYLDITALTLRHSAHWSAFVVNMIFFGPPYAGKATQATLLESASGAIYISYQSLINDAFAADTELGRQARQAIDSGRAIPDNVVIGLVQQRLTLQPTSKGYILAGIPRTITQAEALQDMLALIGKTLDLAVFFDLEFEVMISRAAQHDAADRVPIGARLSTLKINFDHFKLAIGPLMDFYENIGKNLRVNANLSRTDVAAKIAAGVATLST
ncbi:nucleoside monophosphate kinase [Rhizobium sp. CFBP 13717]|nr:nucleoside monophosphate kinase [Rhizobium sp. CFBP 13644]MBD8694040.1 nucleoside monophosphate kinase [Rhizobium sp. CFBP 13717]